MTDVTLYHGDCGEYQQPQGRWPANLILECSCDSEQGETHSPDCVCGMLDAQTGELKTGDVKPHKNAGSWKQGSEFITGSHKGDTGGASRFFYCAKASKAERNAGLDDNVNGHPTIKPLKLMEYLCRLTAPPTGGVVLDPFMGSGSTGIAAVNEGRDFIGIEIDRDYFEIAKKRVATVAPEIKTPNLQVTEMTEKILVVDGGNLGHQSKHAYSDVQFKGMSTSVLFGFMKILMGLIRKHNPTSVIVCWDGGVPSERRRLMPQYKANRDHGDEEEYKSFLSQVDILHRVLPERFGITSVRRAGIEADDLMAACCDLLDVETILVTADKDLYQLINTQVSLYDPRKRALITLQNFEKASDGVGALSWLSYKAMIGDPSDNIPGVAGVGPVTAKKILKEAGPDLGLIIKRAKEGELTVNKRVIESLREFDSQKENTLAAISLSSDISGARMALLSSLRQGTGFDLTESQKFFRGYGIISLSGEDISGAFSSLVDPARFQSESRLEAVRVPAIPPERRPVL